MKKYDLEDTTFIIPLRIDTIDRLENLLFCTNHLLKYFNTKILILEADTRNRNILNKMLNKKITYVFREDKDPIFFRTSYINKIVQATQTPYIAIWDADVIAPVEQIISSIDLLRKDEADFVYPYKGLLLDVPTCIKNIYSKKENIHVLNKFSSGFHFMYGQNAVGGGFFTNRLKYIEAGMENENFYGWGLEDGERFVRWHKLGYRISRVEGSLFHLFHERGMNSSVHSEAQSYFKTKEKVRITNMSKTLLLEEIQSWPQVKPL